LSDVVRLGSRALTGKRAEGKSDFRRSDFSRQVRRCWIRLRCGRPVTRRAVLRNLMSCRPERSEGSAFDDL